MSKKDTLNKREKEIAKAEVAVPKGKTAYIYYAVLLRYR